MEDNLYETLVSNGATWGGVGRCEAWWGVGAEFLWVHCKCNPLCGDTLCRHQGLSKTMWPSATTTREQLRMTLAWWKASRLRWWASTSTAGGG